MRLLVKFVTTWHHAGGVRGVFGRILWAARVSVWRVAAARCGRGRTVRQSASRRWYGPANRCPDDGCAHVVGDRDRAEASSIPAQCQPGATGLPGASAWRARGKNKIRGPVSRRRTNGRSAVSVSPPWFAGTGFRPGADGSLSVAARIWDRLGIAAVLAVIGDPQALGQKKLQLVAEALAPMA
jgi:hypothetical protein